MKHILTREELARGRKIGAPLGGKVTMNKPAPTDCFHCECMGYQRMSQHLGHLGFKAVMENNPTALHSLREKIRGKKQHDRNL